MITSGDDGAMEHIYKGYPVENYNFVNMIEETNA